MQMREQPNTAIPNTPILHYSNYSTFHFSPGAYITKLWQKRQSPRRPRINQTLPRKPAAKGSSLKEGEVPIPFGTRPGA